MKRAIGKRKFGARGLLAVVGCGAAMTFASATAEAAVPAYYESGFDGNSWFFGNDAFLTTAQIVGVGSGEGSFTDNKRTYITNAAQHMFVLAEVFGKRYTIIESRTETLAESRSSKYASVNGYLKMGGNTLWAADPERNTDCPPTATIETACDAYRKNLSKTFFEQSQTIPVAGVPVTVSALVRGGIRADVSANSTVMQGTTANRNHHFGTVLNSASSGAYATATLEASAGVPYMADVGVTASFTLIDATAGASTTTFHRNEPAQRLFKTNSTVGFTIRSMNGNVSVWGRLFGIKHTSTVINVAGYHKYIPFGEFAVSKPLEELAL